MALVKPTREFVDGDPNVILWTWALTSADTTGYGVKFVQHADLAWQATGDFGSTGVCAAQGSNTDVDADYGAMTNSSGGSAITYSAAGAPKQSVERPLFVRPKMTTAGTNAAVSATLLMRRNPGK